MSLECIVMSIAVVNMESYVFPLHQNLWSRKVTSKPNAPGSNVIKLCNQSFMLKNIPLKHHVTFNETAAIHCHSLCVAPCVKQAAKSLAQTFTASCSFCSLTPQQHVVCFKPLEMLLFVNSFNTLCKRELKICSKHQQPHAVDP